ncbi:MAG: HEAT repeat domain-containing protein [Myxococcota bacterium]|nr:HEAT repeat domain-containing protein [Myxococcota bacterium]
MRNCLVAFMIMWAVSSFPASSFSAPSVKEKRLLRVLKTDSSYKVRLQALRILGRKLTSKSRNLDYLVDQVGNVIKEDQHYMVRGLACFLLGQSKSEQAREALEFASSDQHPFVRVQSKSALQKLTLRSTPKVISPALEVATSTASRTLVFTAETMPGTPVSSKMIDSLVQRMEQQLQALASEQFTVKNGFSNREVKLDDSRLLSGFKFRASIAERSIRRERGTRVRSTVTVRVTITTWPGNQLRHVISATASGVIRRAKKTAILKLESQVLMSAIDQAVSDAMKEISTS